MDPSKILKLYKWERTVQQRIGEGSLQMRFDVCTKIREMLFVKLLPSRFHF